MKRLSVIFLLTALLPSAVFSQQKNLPLNREWGLHLETYLNSCFSKGDSSFLSHICGTARRRGSLLQSTCTTFRPYFENEVFDYDLYSHPEDGMYYEKPSKFHRKLKDESLIIIKDSSDNFLLTLDPLFNFEYGKDLLNDSVNYFYKNTRGILVRGDIGEKFSFESSFYENQATFVDYIKNFNDTYLIVPGQGRWKKFKANGYDFAMASGYISYSPNENFNFQLGHGKHFVGDGYRSLLLSDNSFNYPFARITSKFGRFQYTNLYTSFMNLNYGSVPTPAGTEPLFQKKAGNFQFLSWNVTKRFQWGFFQGLIWKASDSTNKQCLKLSYASPIIYTAAAVEGLDGDNNVIAGSTFKFKASNSISIYGQYMLDKAGGGANDLRYGLQLGMKYFDVFGIRNLHFQLETNRVTPYSYAEKHPAQSYSHYNQPLAHPLGADFGEVITILNYRIGDFFTQLKFNYADIGIDHSGQNYGNNIFLSDSNQAMDLEFWERTLAIIDFHIGYLVNPSTNFNIIAGISNRSSNSYLENSHTNFVYFGIRTSLTNTYYDF